MALVSQEISANRPRSLSRDASSDSEVEEFRSEQPSKKRKLSNDSENELRDVEDVEGEEDEEDDEDITKFQAPSRITISDPVKSSTNSVNATLLSTSTGSSTFESLNVSPWLIRSLSAMQITRPTAIQTACIPQILNGLDCIGGSRTGTGKTIAFAVPLLQQWAVDPFGIYAVILTPTRELALQIYEQFQALGSPQALKTILVVGGTEMRPQAIALAQRPHVVVATPGRLADHIHHSGEDTIAGLRRAKAVVLDEADRLLDASGPGSMLGDVDTCLSALPNSENRQTLLFTATVTREVHALKSSRQSGTGKPPLFFTDIGTSSAQMPSMLPALLTQTYLLVPPTQKDSFLHAFLNLPSTAARPSIIVFTNRTSTADLLHRTLLSLEHRVTSLHSRLPQSQRSSNLSAFRGQKTQILVATDVASRGLDIPSNSLVINYDVPRNPDDYVHRVGRTARSGKKGLSVTFVGQRDVDLILAIEEHTASKMDEWKEEGVNVETRVLRGRLLKDVGEARLKAIREMGQNKDVTGRKKKVLLRTG